MEELKFATFKPILNPIADMQEYYSENGLTPTNDYMQRYLDENKLDTKPTEINTTTEEYKPTIADLNSKISYAVDKPETFYNEEAPYRGKPINPSVASKNVINFFMKKGLSKEQASGIAGNFYVESSFNPGNIGDKHLPTASEGLGQWREGRLANLKNFAKSQGKDYRDFNTQLEFTWRELNSSENRALQAILQAKDAKSAARAFAYNYERMKKYDVKREAAADSFSKV